MIGFVLRRLLWYPFLLVLFLLASFLLIYRAPGGPFDKERALPEQIERNLQRRFSLDQPVLPLYRDHPDLERKASIPLGGSYRLLYRLDDIRRTQFFHYLGGLLRGDLGPSFRYLGRSVNDLIAQTLPVSLALGGAAILFAVLLGLPAGMLAAARRNTAVDHASMAFAMLGICVPNFILGPLLIIAFVFLLGWLPVGGWGTPAQVILPAVTLGAVRAAYIARLTRTGMLDALSQDYVRTARAKGLPPRTVVGKHALKVGILPVVTYMGPAFSEVFVGSLVVEAIFNIPGMGSFFVQSALNRDYFLALGCEAVFFTILMVLNLLVDVSYAFLDPRIQAQG